MPDNEFTFDNGSPHIQSRSDAGAGCGGCPLSRVDEDMWRRIGEAIAPRPFRKRHPFVFWGAMLAVLCLAVSGLARAVGDVDSQITEDCLALVAVRGPIADIAPTLDWLAKIEREPRVKGILLRVDSPGGGAAASQELYAALARVGKSKPIVVSMGSMAASGGLMVSMAGERVFANASTATGSIGVRMDIPQLQGLASKLGVGQETLTTARYKDAASVLHPLSDEGREYLNKVLADMHGQFVDIVARGRNISQEEAARLADGRIFTGREAKELGLVDELGGYGEAHRWLSAKTGVPMSTKLAKPKPKRDWMERALRSWTGIDLEAISRMGARIGARGWPESPMFLYQF